MLRDWVLRFANRRSWGNSDVWIFHLKNNGPVLAPEKQEKKRSANTTLEVDKNRPANAPLIELYAIDFLITAESSARRYNSKGRGSVYNGILGICCHFCRQKKLCGEEECKRCGNCDVDEPCLGKTDCSVCHSSNGVFCRACLKVRYGEEIEEMRENNGWMCPHCIEEKGINPYWICNSSICLRKRNMSPTGLAIYRATNEEEQEQKRTANTTLKVEEKTPAKSDYEVLREARLLENKARLESLGVLNKVSQLREASTQTKKTRPYHKRVCGLTPVRRSQRINPVTTTPSTAEQLQLQVSQQLKTSSSNPFITTPEKQEKKRSANTTLEVDKNRPANAPLIELDAIDLLIAAESSARRCNSKGRGSVYNGILGICCHFCRQKKLCGEEECKRCGNCDVDEPCLGKTDCSVCHSSNGVFCRACLKVRYGEGKNK